MDFQMKITHQRRCSLQALEISSVMGVLNRQNWQMNSHKWQWVASKWHAAPSVYSTDQLLVGIRELQKVNIHLCTTWLLSKDGGYNITAGGWEEGVDCWDEEDGGEGVDWWGGVDCGEEVECWEEGDLKDWLRLREQNWSRPLWGEF